MTWSHRSWIMPLLFLNDPPQLYSYWSLLIASLIELVHRLWLPRKGITEPLHRSLVPNPFWLVEPMESRTAGSRRLGYKPQWHIGLCFFFFSLDYRTPRTSIIRKIHHFHLAPRKVERLHISLHPYASGNTEYDKVEGMYLTSHGDIGCPPHLRQRSSLSNPLFHGQPILQLPQLHCMHHL